MTLFSLVYCPAFKPVAVGDTGNYRATLSSHVLATLKPLKMKTKQDWQQEYIYFFLIQPVN